MRARLITALALGCCLHLGRARADDFDDDFGTLPPPPAPAPSAPPPAPRPVGPAAAPVAPTPPAAPTVGVVPAQTAPPNEGDPWQGSYPPLDDEDPTPAAREAEARRNAFSHSTVEGLVGGVHIVDAASAWHGSFRVALQGGFFRKNDFLVRGDQHRFGTGALTLSVTPIDHLELAANVSTYVTENQRSDPTVVQVVGDTHLFAKGYARVLPWFSLGGDLELALLNGVGTIGVRGGATSVGLRANATADLRALPRRGVPLILRSNLRYLFDNSGKLVDDVEDARYASLRDPGPRESEYRHLVSPSERYALGVSRVDRLALGFGVEVPLRPHPRVAVSPLLEWAVAIPVNRQDFDCLATRISGQRDGCLAQEGFAAWPSNLTLGLRTQPYVNGLGLLVAVDVATSGARSFARELAPESRSLLRFAVSYAFDPRSAPPPRVRVQRIEIPAGTLRGHIVGSVVESQTGAPVPNAVVHFENTSLSDVVSDESGGFRSAELGPGAQGMRVRAEGYREALCVAVLTSQGTDVSARCELTPSAYYGSLAGRIVDNAGKAVGDARVTLRGPSELILATHADGTFSAPKLAEGDYEAVVSADGYFPRTTRVSVARGQASAPSLTLIPRSEQPSARVIKNRIALLKPVAFNGETAILAPQSESILAEVAEQLQKHPGLKRVEIQAHGEDGPAGTLTQERADAVRAWLIGAGINADRLSAKGYGTSRPLVPNITPQNRARNRRIELIAR